MSCSDAELLPGRVAQRPANACPPDPCASAWLGLDGSGRRGRDSRWSNANPRKIYQRQPFGGFAFEFREFDGYTLPSRIEGGNFIGTRM